MFKKESNSRKIGFRILIILILVAAGLGGLTYVQEKYTIQTVYVEGNLHYTNEEIEQLVMEGALGHNSIYLSFIYKNKEINEVPFVDAIDVMVLSPDSVKIVVYEKALAGYVVFLGKYMYFDKDGTIVESSTIKTQGIPEITGLSFSQVVLGEQLPIEEVDIFNHILEITKILEKYELVADKLYFDQNKKVIIYFNEVRVILEEKVLSNDQAQLLKEIVPTVSDKSGVLNISNENNIYFKEDEKK